MFRIFSNSDWSMKRCVKPFFLSFFSCWQCQLWTPVFLRASSEAWSLSAEQFWSAVKPRLVLPSLLRCSGGGRGAQPLWEHEPRLDEAPKLLQNCSADKDKSANTSVDGLRKTGVHSRNCHHTEKRLWNIFLELYCLHRRFEPRWYF